MNHLIALLKTERPVKFYVIAVPELYLPSV